MKVLTNNSTPLRTLRLSICVSLLSVFLIACGSDGKDNTPVNQSETADAGEGLTDGPTSDTGGGLLSNVLTVDTGGGLPISQLTSNIGGELMDGPTDDADGGFTDGPTGDTDGGFTDGPTGDTDGGSTDVPTGDTDGGFTDGPTGDTDGGSTDGPTNATGGVLTSGTPVGTGEQFSCDGTRVWGPYIIEEGVSAYVSEAGGLKNGGNCLVLWGYSTIADCQILFLDDLDGAIAETAANGELNLSVPDGTLNFPIANISFTELAQTIDCNDVDENVFEQTGPTTGGGTPLSCEGTRNWGPIIAEGVSIYVSEAGGLENNIDCGVVWGYLPEVDCQVLVTEEFEGVNFEIAADGTLNLIGGADTFNMSAADISYTDLAQTIDCYDLDESEFQQTGPTDGGGTTDGDIIIVDGELTPLSCAGNRVWGPIDDVYISEAGALATPRECAIYWNYDATQNCASNSNIADDATARVNDEGSLDFRFGNSAFELGLADISLTDLTNLPVCP